MKPTVCILLVLFSFAGLRLIAAEQPTSDPGIELRFQQADLDLALEQYKRLRMTAFEITLKLRMENAGSEEQRKQLLSTRAELEEEAAKLRLKTVSIAH